MIVTCETTSTCAHHATVMLRRLAGRDWQAVIGIESHAQIKSRHKLFSQRKNQGASPNSAVAVLDAAFPGTLPVCFLFVFIVVLTFSRHSIPHASTWLCALQLRSSAPFNPTPHSTENTTFTPISLSATKSPSNTVSSPTHPHSPFHSLLSAPR